MADVASTAPAPQSGATPGTTVDPYRAYNFKLIILGVTQGSFTQCSGFGIRVDPISYMAGGDVVERKIPGRVHYDEITLHYGLTDSLELWEWMQSAVKGTVERKNVQIVLLDADGITEKLRWTLYNAWPSAWRGAPLNTSNSEIAIESLELQYETLDRQ